MTARLYIRAALLLGLALAAAGAAIPRADAATCPVRLDGNYTVTASCDWPCGYAAYGDVIVGAYTITLPASCVMSVNLPVNKITFTSGKISIGAGAYVRHVSGPRYVTPAAYVSAYCAGNNGPCATNCPAGSYPLNVAQTAFVVATTTGVAQDGNVMCAYP